jgi:hypothetical protein
MVSQKRIKHIYKQISVKISAVAKNDSASNFVIIELTVAWKNVSEFYSINITKVEIKIKCHCLLPLSFLLPAG